MDFNFDVVALGELLVDFTYTGKSEYGMKLFEQNPGGAPANVLCALGNLGLKTSFIGKVGSDMHGKFLRSVLIDKNIDTSGLVMTDDAFTTLAFVALSDKGEREFSFARKPGADTCLNTFELKTELLNQCKIFHFGSLSLTDEPSRSTTIEAVKIAKKAGAIISYDPNYRSSLWKSESYAKEIINSVLEFVDVMKLSDEETELITGRKSYEESAEFLLSKGIKCAVVTLGENGAYAAVNNSSAFVPTRNVDVIDTTGAGDAFWGGFLYKLSKSDIDLDNLSNLDLTENLEFARDIAELCIQKRGAIPAMPTISDVETFRNIKN